MTDLQTSFEKAQKQLTTLTERPRSDQLLMLFALFKQATEGDAPQAPPPDSDAIGRAKHQAWMRLKGTAAADAKTQYVALVNTLAGS
jgi:diazepam-binding inhibitor (GABA receptor modulator, acyl-CoA-binding protein)